MVVITKLKEILGLTAKRRLKFDPPPELYDRIRPGYPESMLREVESITQLSPGARIVEIGPGTGHATGYWLTKGYSVDALEPGNRFADFLEHKFAGNSGLHIHRSTFENWQPSNAGFDLVLAAQSFHWLEIEQALDKALALLSANGHLALLFITHNCLNCILQSDLTKTYSRYGIRYQGINNNVVAAVADRIRNCNFFDDPQQIYEKRERHYSCQEFLDLRSTRYSDLSLPERVRQKLHRDLETLIAGYGGVVDESIETFAIVARKQQKL